MGVFRSLVSHLAHRMAGVAFAVSRFSDGIHYCSIRDDRH